MENVTNYRHNHEYNNKEQIVVGGELWNEIAESIARKMVHSNTFFLIETAQKAYNFVVAQQACFVKHATHPPYKPEDLDLSVVVPLLTQAIDEKLRMLKNQLRKTPTPTKTIQLLATPLRRNKNPFPRTKLQYAQHLIRSVLYYQNAKHYLDGPYHEDESETEMQLRLNIRSRILAAQRSGISIIDICQDLLKVYQTQSKKEADSECHGLPPSMNVPGATLPPPNRPPVVCNKHDESLKTLLHKKWTIRQKQQLAQALETYPIGNWTDMEKLVENRSRAVVRRLGVRLATKYGLSVGDYATPELLRELLAPAKK